MQQLPPIPRAQVRPLREQAHPIPNPAADLLPEIEAKAVRLGVLILQVRKDRDGNPILKPSVLGGFVQQTRWVPNNFGRYCWDLLTPDQQATATAIAKSDKSRLWPWLRDGLEIHHLQIMADRLGVAVEAQIQAAADALQLKAAGAQLSPQQLEAIRVDAEGQIRSVRQSAAYAARRQALG